MTASDLLISGRLLEALSIQNEIINLFLSQLKDIYKNIYISSPKFHFIVSKLAHFLDMQDLLLVALFGYSRAGFHEMGLSMSMSSSSSSGGAANYYIKYYCGVYYYYLGFQWIYRIARDKMEHYRDLLLVDADADDDVQSEILKDSSSQKSIPPSQMMIIARRRRYKVLRIVVSMIVPMVKLGLYLSIIKKPRRLLGKQIIIDINHLHQDPIVSYNYFYKRLFYAQCVRTLYVVLRLLTSGLGDDDDDDLQREQQRRSNNSNYRLLGQNQEMMNHNISSSSQLLDNIWDVNEEQKRLVEYVNKLNLQLKDFYRCIKNHISRTIYKLKVKAILMNFIRRGSGEKNDNCENVVLCFICNTIILTPYKLKKSGKFCCHVCVFENQLDADR